LQTLQNAARQLEVLLGRDNDATDFITSTRNGAELIYKFLNLKAWIDGSYDRLKEEKRFELIHQMVPGVTFVAAPVKRASLRQGAISGDPCPQRHGRQAAPMSHVLIIDWS
jgi:hypothetical protein